MIYLVFSSSARVCFFLLFWEACLFLGDKVDLSQYQNIMTSLNIEWLSLQGKGKEEGFCFDLGKDYSCDLRWCLVDRFFCDIPVHVRSMKVKIADMWRPMKAITMKQANEGIFLFHFYHNLGMEVALRAGGMDFW